MKKPTARIKPETEILWFNKVLFMIIPWTMDKFHTRRGIGISYVAHWYLPKKFNKFPK
jgi:hypothetical protein